MSQTNNLKTNYGALSTLSTVFFFWGFIAAGNSVFIPFCKNYFHLDQFQSQLIDFSFYIAYYTGALGIFIFSTTVSKDIVGTWGYKKSIVYGLLFSAFGAAIMIVSVYFNVFVGMLLGLFIVALGFSLQQTSANPFMIMLGDEATGGNRISLGGGINSLGTTIGPLIVALALFGTASAISDDMIKSLPLTKVIILYAFVGILFVAVAALFGFSKKVPAGKITPILEENPSMVEGVKPKKAMYTLLIITVLLAACFAPVFNSYRTKEAKKLVQFETQLEEVVALKKDEKNNFTEAKIAENRKTEAALKMSIAKTKMPLEKNRLYWLSAGLLVVVAGLLFAFAKGKKQKVGWGAMQYPQLTLGMLAIFAYVGVEVAIGSNLGELLKQKEFGGYGSSEIAPFIAMFWGSLMIGRWAGAINAFNFSEQTKQILKVIVPLVAFGLVLGFTKLAGYNIDKLYMYTGCVIFQIVASFLTKDKPALTLGVFGFLGIAAIIVGMMTTGLTAVYAFLSCGLFCSIMWPSIFSLSLAGLGGHQSQGSSFLVMMILGGAILPPIQGKLADIIGIQFSFVIGAVCFAYLVIFAFSARRILKKQGVSLDENAIATH
jgi:FHS family L-fucose permease-like MFS transporter